MSSASFSKPKPTVLVIFGASGDLTKKKLIPALYNLFREDLLPDDFHVVGASRTKFSDQAFLEALKPAVMHNSRSSLDEEVWQRYLAEP